MKHHKQNASAALAGLIFIFTICLNPELRTNGQTTRPAYKNPSLPIEKRVDDLVSRMTLEEKALQMVNNAPARKLYARAGFREVGKRAGYYRRPEGAASALILRRDLIGGT